MRTRRRAMPGILSGILLLASGSTRPAHSTTYDVLPDGSGDFPTIQDAVSAASDGDEILLGNGTFTGAGNFAVSYLGKALTIRSQSGDPAAVVIDLSSMNSSAFTLTGGEGPLSVLSDMTVLDDGTSGRLVLTTGSPTIDDVIFDGFSEEAVSSQGGAPTIRNCTFRNGGSPSLYCNGGGLTVSDCLFEANLMWDSSGPVELRSLSSALLERCEIRDNIKVPWSLGSCVYVRSSVADLVDCRVTGNPGTGVTVFSEFSGNDVTLENCTIQDNDAGVLFAALYPNVSTFAVRGCTVSGSQNDGIRATGLYDLTLEDTVVQDNSRGLDATVASGVTGRALTVRRCTFTGNRNPALYGFLPSMTIEDCVVAGNLSRGIDLGPPLTVGSATATVEGTLVAGNGSVGMRVIGLSSLLVDGCTIASNGSGAAGDALDLHSGSGTVTRTVVWGNCAAPGGEIRVYAGSSLEVSCCVLKPASITGGGTVTLTDVTNADPLFCSPVDCASVPSSAGMYTVDPMSPVLSSSCGRIGAYGSGCGVVTGAGASLESSSWARVKASYR